MTNADMVDYWNGRPADVWVTEAERFDTMLAPFGRQLLESAVLKPGERFLDVGCGNGAISLEAARVIGPGGWVTGVDLSAPMLEVARRRAEEQGLDVDFVQCDAQTASFDPPFDIRSNRVLTASSGLPTFRWASLVDWSCPTYRTGAWCGLPAEWWPNFGHPRVIHTPECAEPPHSPGGGELGQSESRSPMPLKLIAAFG